jgi:HJR/Mrr/RecB family endonuclease
MMTDFKGDRKAFVTEVTNESARRTEPSFTRLCPTKPPDTKKTCNPDKKSKPKEKTKKGLKGILNKQGHLNPAEVLKRARIYFEERPTLLKTVDPSIYDDPPLGR